MMRIFYFLVVSCHVCHKIVNPTKDTHRDNLTFMEFIYVSIYLRNYNSASLSSWHSCKYISNISVNMKRNVIFIAIFKKMTNPTWSTQFYFRSLILSVTGFVFFFLFNFSTSFASSHVFKLSSHFSIVGQYFVVVVAVIAVFSLSRINAELHLIYLQTEI